MKLNELYFNGGSETEEFGTELLKFVDYLVVRYLFRHDDDVRSRAVVRVYEALDYYDESQNFLTFIFTVVRNSISTDIYRAGRKLDDSYHLDAALLSTPEGEVLKADLINNTVNSVDSLVKASDVIDPPSGEAVQRAKKYDFEEKNSHSKGDSLDFEILAAYLSRVYKLDYFTLLLLFDRLGADLVYVFYLFSGKNIRFVKDITLANVMESISDIRKKLEGEEVELKTKSQQQTYDLLRGVKKWQN